MVTLAFLVSSWGLIIRRRPSLVPSGIYFTIEEKDNWYFEEIVKNMEIILKMFK